VNRWVALTLTTKAEESTETILAGVSNNAVPFFQPLDATNTVVSVLCQFFNISNPSDDDMIFLLLARRYGFSEAKRGASELGCNCAVAIGAFERLLA
jgi:hypothetical protein